MEKKNEKKQEKKKETDWEKLRRIREEHKEMRERYLPGENPKV